MCQLCSGSRKKQTLPQRCQYLGAALQWNLETDFGHFASSLRERWDKGSPEAEDKGFTRKSHTPKGGRATLCVYLSAAAIWVPTHFSNKGTGWSETSVLTTLESGTSRPVAVSASCLCSDCSQMSALDTRGPMLDSVFGWRPRLQNGYIKRTHTDTHMLAHPDTQFHCCWGTSSS